MSIWRIKPVTEIPTITLRPWLVFDVPLGSEPEPSTRHFVGYSVEGGIGQVCSPVLTFDPVQGAGVTHKGRVYLLKGAPGWHPDAEYTWNRWKELNGIQGARDITLEVWHEIRAHQANGAGSPRTKP